MKQFDQLQYSDLQFSHCIDHRGMTAGMDHNDIVNLNKFTQFGFLPPGPLKVYHGPPIQHDIILDVITSHSRIRQSGKHNFLGLSHTITVTLKD